MLCEGAMTDRIYLDYAASTPVRSEVLEAMQPFFRGAYNASAVHAEGRRARAALDDARERVAACIGARAKEVVFTSGGSEADNLALAGTARALRERSRRIVSSAIEHHAVLHALDALRGEGFEIETCRVTEHGLVDELAFAQALRGSPVALASVMYVNNELGTVQPIATLAKYAHAAGALFHSDAVQAAEFLPVDVRALGVDLLSLSAHKVYGPKGVGALYVRAGTPVVPILHGGSQEFAKRAGTENLAGIAGFARALELAVAEREANAARVSGEREEFERAVLARIPDVRVNGCAAPRAPHIANLAFRGAPSERLLLRLDLAGLAVSAGSACASGVVEPSHVVEALGLPPEWAGCVLRFSFGLAMPPDAVRCAVEVLDEAVSAVRAA